MLIKNKKNKNKTLTWELCNGITTKMLKVQQAVWTEERTFLISRKFINRPREGGGGAANYSFQNSSGSDTGLKWNV